MVSVPFIIPLFLPLAAAFFLIRAAYMRTSREIKRWEATSRSPVFASFSAILKVKVAVVYKGEWIVILH
jgi:ATP-binding cassette subfamily C (CFTR/MRP) protein 4